MLRKSMTFIVALATIGSLGSLAGCSDDENAEVPPGGGGGGGGTTVTLQGFKVVPLVSDEPTLAPVVDANVVNPWGIVPSIGGFWMADNGTGFLSVYTGTGVAAPQNNTVMMEPGITGIAVNSSSVFVMPSGSAEWAGVPAMFLVASETGRVWGVNPTISSQAQVVIDNSAADAIYKGIAITTVAGLPELLVTDFHNGKVAAYDGTFAPISTAGFVDPALPAGYAPFGIAAFGGVVYVTYAVQDDMAEDDVAGLGLGIVDAYDPSGVFLRRVASFGSLNAPWAVALASSKFGTAGSTLLVGNFGDGHITSLDPTTGRELQQLSDVNKNVLAIDGLWGFTFGDGLAAGKPDILYFASGPAGEDHGLYGRVEPVTVTVTQ